MIALQNKSDISSSYIPTSSAEIAKRRMHWAVPLIAVGMVAFSSFGCAALVGGAAGAATGYVAGHEAGEEEAEEELGRDDD